MCLIFVIHTPLHAHTHTLVHTSHTHTHTHSILVDVGIVWFTCQVTSLLSPASFLEVMVQLVGVAKGEKESVPGCLGVQMKALEMLAKKLESKTVRFTQGHVCACVSRAENW